MAWETGSLKTAVLHAIRQNASELNPQEHNQLNKVLQTLGLEHLEDKEVLELWGVSYGRQPYKGLLQTLIRSENRPPDSAGVG